MGDTLGMKGFNIMVQTNLVQNRQQLLVNNQKVCSLCNSLAANGAGLCRNAESKDADMLLIILGKAIYLIELTDPSGSR